MTEEEIRPIAENYVEEYCHCPDGEYTDGSLVCAGIGTALIVSRQLEKRIAEFKKENAQLRESFHDYREQVKNDNESIKEWKEKALKIMRDISACELMKVITKAKQYEALDNLENFLREIPEDSK